MTSSTSGPARGSPHTALEWTHGPRLPHRLCGPRRVADRWPDVDGGVVADPVLRVQGGADAEGHSLSPVFGRRTNRVGHGLLVIRPARLLRRPWPARAA